MHTVPDKYMNKLTLSNSDQLLLIMCNVIKFMKMALFSNKLYAFFQSIQNKNLAVFILY